MVASSFPGRSLAALTILLLLTLTSFGQTVNVLHNFGITNGDGDIPYSNVIIDGKGNLYGTTLGGGANSMGTVYKLSPGANGRWRETVIHSFMGGASDGASPHATLFMDRQHNLYGTTENGGSTSQSCKSTGGCGVIFKLTPSSGGTWTETILHSFAGGSDGSIPYSGLVQDAAGNFYGTTIEGGSKNAGTVYELSPSGSTWTLTVLHNFTGNPDGKTPYGGVIFDSAGNLYGTTYDGGSGSGIVYQLSLQSGSWTEKTLHTFGGQPAGDGSETFFGVVLDKNGNVFGTTSGGGTFNYGTVFELDAANNYASTVLHSFNLDLVDGTFPNAVIFDTAGNLWGSTEGAGQNDGNGTIFKLTPSASGWTETVPFTFQGANDGTYPNTGLLMDSKGNFYGTTIWGGKAGDTNGGVTFQFTP